jgi:hopanoid-associated phosphorylase
MGDVGRPAGRIGIVVGLPQEAAILKRVLRAATPPVACAGATPAGARRAAAEIVGRGAGALLSFGLAGGIDPDLRPGDVIVGAGVVGPDGRMHETDDALARHLCAALDSLDCGWSAGLVAGVDRVVATVAAKQSLAARTGAVIVDMESRAVAEAGLPFAILRVVVDPADHAIPASVQAALRSNGRFNPLVLIGGLLRRPGEIGALRALARDNGAARAGLRRAALALRQALGGAR